jgi:ATP-dependent protease ClpP protease subunit
MPIASALALTVAQICDAESCKQRLDDAKLCGGNRELVKYFAKENTLCITGEIDWGGDFYVDGPHLTALKKLKLKKNIVVILSSSGGELTNAMMMADYLGKYGYRAVVSGFCSSACAQFLFLGAKRRFVMPKSYAGMHGGPFTDEEIDQIDIDQAIKVKMKSAMDGWRKFYTDRNLPLEINYQFPQFVMDQRANGKDALWVPSKKDYEHYGIKVQFCESPAAPPPS